MTALAGMAGLAGLQRLRAGESELRARYVERSGRLQTIRSGILLSGTLARDYFVNPADPDAGAVHAEWKRVEQRTRRALDAYAPDGLAATLPLRGEVMAHWKVLDLMAEMARDRRRPGVEAYFQRQLAQRRESMLRIADDVETALEDELRDGEMQAQRMYNRLRLLLVAAPVTLAVFGCGLAFATMRRLMRLEGEAQALSAQLVKAQEEERRSIARELHDEIGQWLSALRLNAGQAMAEAGGETLSRLEAIAELAERSVEALRRIALSLRPSMLDDLGLVPALEWQARETGRLTGIHVEVRAEEASGELPESHRTCIFRVAQEALYNCARHSEAKRIDVALHRGSGGVSLQVDDDGKGFVAERTRGLGLLGMAERVGHLGGRLRVRSEPGRGTTVTAELPL